MSLSMQVVQTNNDMAASIASLFKSLVAEILPKFKFSVELLGADAHDGMRLKYALLQGE
jgi:hypothetical protein